MDAFIAKENIRRFSSLLRTETGESQRRVLLDLLSLENEKLAAAVGKIDTNRDGKIVSEEVHAIITA
ncbi:hypothetical protein HT585_24025 [Ensifer sp. HO-A22]|uniref:EF-hand domain-containing protein n=1 Tax=Ensifer oleiphilus TaxID=2742698 RepID=A0A7Y6UQ01_9HYPH|nr:hypothetical protein [Ensifer oleiphilus]NVD41940.1 hypothetical protein [Ensifer oleiphilus]